MMQSPTSRNDASGNEFEALHDKIQEQLVMEDMPTSSKSMKWRIQLVRMVSELAMRFQQEQKYCNDETQRLKQMLSQQQQLTTTPSKNESPGQSRQLQRLRKVASRMHKEILILREKVKRTEAESKSKDEKISELVEESQKNVWRIETSEKRVKDMETQLAIKSSNLEAALTSSLSIAESHAAAERRIAEMERQLATGYTNLRREIDRTVMGSPSENSNNKNNGSHQWSRFGMGEIDKEKTTMIPATTKDEPLLIVSELRDMLLDLWNQLHQVAEASSLMSGAPETIEDLENWCKTHPESELTMRGIERVMFWSLGGKHDFDDFLRALCFSKGSDVSVLLPPASSDDGDDDKKWYDRKPTNIDLTTKNRRPAKQLTMPPPPQKEKGAELHARHTALSRRAEEFISGLTSKATTTNSRVVYSVDSPRQMNNGSYNADMTLEPRLREIAVSIRELQEWSLRLRGRKEVEAISNSLARVIIGFMHAVELYMTRPRNVEVVSATILELRRSLRGPQDLYEQFQVSTSEWWRQTSRKYIHTKIVRSIKLCSRVSDLRTRARFVAAELRRSRRRLGMVGKSVHIDIPVEVVEVFSDAERKFRDVQDSLRIGFGYADNNAVDLMIDERMSLLDEILESLAELRLVSSTTSHHMSSGVDNSSILTSPPTPTTTTTPMSSQIKGGYGLTPPSSPSSPPKMDIKEIPLDTNGDGTIDMIGYDVNNNGKPDYVGLVGDGDEVTKLVPLDQLDATTLEMINLAMANKNAAESPVLLDGLDVPSYSKKSSISKVASESPKEFLIQASMSDSPKDLPPAKQKKKDVLIEPLKPPPLSLEDPPDVVSDNSDVPITNDDDDPIESTKDGDDGTDGTGK